MNARALALMLNDVGVNVDCLPMLDVRQPGAADIVGDYETVWRRLKPSTS